MQRRLGLGSKRWMDVVVAGLVIVLSLPVAIVTAVLILLEDGRPVFFRQLRAGRDGRPFYLLKFRSMRVNSVRPETVGIVGGNHPLVTKVGRIIRRTKVDELPQLLNVLIGEMSLVGPRPTLLEQVQEYDAVQRRRLATCPGLTGWAQVHGNTRLTWNERILLDVWYVDNWSLWLDIVTLWKTVGVVIGGERPDNRVLEEAKRHAGSPCGSR